MKNKTNKDLFEIKIIEDKMDQLRKQKENVIKNCKCLDYELGFLETMEYEYHIHKLCIVCWKGKKSNKLKENYKFLKEFLYEVEKYSDKDIKKMAKDGGL